MSARPYDIAVVGEINPDLILSGDVVPQFGQVEQSIDDLTLTIGSSAVIFACGAARLGLRVLFLGKVGTDEFGSFMLKAMQERAIDTSAVQIDPRVRTGISVILNRGNDRAILTYPGAIPLLTLDDIPVERLAQARHLHLTSYFIQTNLRPAVPALFTQVRAAGLTISLDTNYDPANQWDGGLLTALEQVDVFLPNETEACRISGQPEIGAAITSLAARIPTLAVKLGAQGAVALAGGQRAEQAALPMQVVDTVGAGDSFDAGFLYGYLQGWQLAKSLRLGAVCGSLSTRAAGGTTAQATLAEAQAYL
jgi:sugar/nucleoside kinase (ribokinase family)